MPTDDGTIGRKGVIVTHRLVVKFLGFYPAAWSETTVAFGEVVGPVANGDAGADSAVDQIDWLLKSPGLVKIIDAKLGCHKLASHQLVDGIGSYLHVRRHPGTKSDVLRERREHHCTYHDGCIGLRSIPITTTAREQRIPDEGEVWIIGWVPCAEGYWSATSTAQSPVPVPMSTILCGFSTGEKNALPSNIR